MLQQFSGSKKGDRNARLQPLLNDLFFGFFLLPLSPPSEPKRVSSPPFFLVDLYSIWVATPQVWALRKISFLPIPLRTLLLRSASIVPVNHHLRKQTLEAGGYDRRIPETRHPDPHRFCKRCGGRFRHDHRGLRHSFAIVAACFGHRTLPSRLPNFSANLLNAISHLTCRL